MSLFASEDERLERFPVAKKQIFLGHAGVNVLPRCVADAMSDQVRANCENHQEFGDVLRDFEQTRRVCAALIGADKSEIALLGPTALGLSLFANGLTWQVGDEILCYEADYPSNVYPWMALTSQGVKLRFLRPEAPGRITPELVAAALTPCTKLVALASCHYLSGWRIDVDAIGQILHAKGILFSLDAIQTVGAFPVSVAHLDFLSADAHKWMLGPMAIGIVYVARRNFEICRPTLLGAWNVRSPEFLTEKTIKFVDSAQRYEPGVLNSVGIYGMRAGLEMLLETGLDVVSQAILDTSDHLRVGLEDLGFTFLSPPRDNPMRSGIVTASHPQVSSKTLFAILEKSHITASLRKAHDGTEWLRFSPHFYNTRSEMERVTNVLHQAIAVH
mgnify:CR=1 FL=1|jgi:cysteine desulfurase / selenocysteine lyase